METGVKTNLLLCCGDFQAVRSQADMTYLSCPPKYRKLGDFAKYADGTSTAPVLTIFIGGNHEAVNLSQELYYGGWVAKNIFYLGHSGVIRVGLPNSIPQDTLRVAGISGIYKAYDYNRGYFERMPFDQNALKSFCHIRAFDVNKLKAIREPVDIFLSHDWPQGIERHGNWGQLIRHKPFFEKEICTGDFGNPATACLLATMKPRYWFAAHLHTKFCASVSHGDQATEFTALDKPLPGRRQFIDFLNISPLQDSSDAQPRDMEARELSVYYDEEWLALLSQCNSRVPVGYNKYRAEELAVQSPDMEARKAIQEAFMRYREAELQNPELGFNSVASSQNSLLLEWPRWTPDMAQDLGCQRRFTLQLIASSDVLSDKLESLERNSHLQSFTMSRVRNIPANPPNGLQLKRVCYNTGATSEGPLPQNRAEIQKEPAGSSGVMKEAVLSPQDLGYLDSEELDIDCT